MVNLETEKLPWEVVEDKTWDAVVEYLDRRMARNRRTNGKFCIQNNELWHLKKAMQEVDPAIKNVGKTFDEHEHSDFENGEGSKE